MSFKLFVLLSLLAGSFGNVSLLNTAFSTDNRIVNGTNAKEGEIPYIVSLQINRQHSCGGSILDKTHILTAAHCVYGMTHYPFTVQYGVLNIYYTDKNIIKVSKIVYHEEYNIDGGDGLYNDIAVLTLASPMNFSETVKPIVLPKQSSKTPAGAPAILAGWGHEKSRGSVQPNLQRVDIKIYSDDDCENLHNHLANRNYHLCAGVPEGGKGQCSGDSGGPLHVNGIQVGVVSWSVKPCTVKGYPGVFAKVANYVDWINKQVK